MAELVDAPDSKSGDSNIVPVRVRPLVPLFLHDNAIWAQFERNFGVVALEASFEPHETMFYAVVFCLYFVSYIKKPLRARGMARRGSLLCLNACM